MKLLFLFIFSLFFLTVQSFAVANLIPATPEVLGKYTSEEVIINVVETASLESIPKGWEDRKKEERYLMGRELFPSSNFVEIDIAALPAYEITIRVKNSKSDDCTLIYVPEGGNSDINQSQKRAIVKIGAKYQSKDPKKIMLDLYEDLYTYLGFVFKKVDSIEIRGDYLLEDAKVYDQPALIRAAGEENIDLPEINISFDDRFYLDSMFSKKDPINIADTPEIKIDFTSRSGIRYRSAVLKIDEMEYNAAKGDFSLVVVKPQRNISPFEVDYAMYMLRITPDKELPFGEHELSFKVENAYGMIISREVFARVVSIPATIVGRPMVYPNPFNPSRDHEAKIQYKLSMATNIELAIFGVDGSVVSRKRFGLGQEGGKKGYNTVFWNGMTDAGMRVSNGIYSGVLIDKDENRILEKFLITIYQ
ncbi:MAG: hypothetical protein U9R38_00870 [Candidatus Margulisiibacteriota bacterium]|nr:hypothetical protein [Candidatus Margulisiibacteriota bacterium]